MLKSKIICNYRVLNNLQVLGKNNYYFLISSSQTEICHRGGVFQRLISKGLVSDFINNKDYEITSRDTRDFS